MLTQTISAPARRALNERPTQIPPSVDQFGALVSCAGVIATEFTYKREEEIYGEDEPAEYVYQVVRGAVRTYKLLSEDVARSARFICRATSSALIPPRTIG